MGTGSDLDVYEIAYLCGGPERVAMVALVVLHDDGQIKISPGRHRVTVLRREPRDPIETAALDLIPDAGKALGAAVRALALSPAIGEVGQELRTKGLRPPSRATAVRPWGPAGAGRRLRRALTESGDPGLGGPGQVAVQGSAGIADPALRRTFETPDPLPAARRRTPRRRDGEFVDDDQPLVREHVLDRAISFLRNENDARDGHSGTHHGGDFGGHDSGGGGGGGGSD